MSIRIKTCPISILLTNPSQHFQPVYYPPLTYTMACNCNNSGSCSCASSGTCKCENNCGCTNCPKKD
ncbi:hypothetical protein GGR52DRAFT_471190 [Hypoxylon sp. FL1284]|nr:hypothetical protein GGR52DRAFT_471190 [Hypoxylon sp. FL1284]